MNRFFAILFATTFLTVSAFGQHHDHDEGDARVYLPEELAHEAPVVVASALDLQTSPTALGKFSAERKQWQFLMNPLRETPHRAWGEGIQIEGYRDIHLLNAPTAANQFVRDNADVLKADPTNLRMLYSRVIGGKAYVKYRQQYEGLDVLFSHVDLRISQDGKVIMFGSDYHPDVNVDTKPALGLAAAKEFAKVNLSTFPSTDKVEKGELLILPIKRSDKIDYHLAYNFEVRESPDLLWDTYVDAHNGEILWRRNVAMHAHDDESLPVNAQANIVNGRIMIRVYPASPFDELEDRPAPHMRLRILGQTIYTDEDGRFTVDLGSETSATGVIRMDGRYAEVTKPNGTGNAASTIDLQVGQEANFLWEESNSSASERNGYYHTTVISRWIRAIDPSENLEILDEPMEVNIDITSSSCNAFWNGRSINFFERSTTCRNSAELPSVIYHEFGHGINTYLYTSLIGRRTINGAMEEGNADITSNMILDAPQIGLGMFVAGGMLRNSNNNNRYPENVTGAIHTDGMILSGAVWDTREAIGLETTARLAHYAKYGTPDHQNLGIALAEYFLEFLIADDDDGNLANGTPHSVEIVEAFRKHGIPASGIEVFHAGSPDYDKDVLEYPIMATASTPISKEDQIALGITAMNIIYSNRPGMLTPDTLAMSKVDNPALPPNVYQFEGAIPKQPVGSFVRYYFEVFEEYGSSTVSPSSDPDGAYMFLVGFESKIFNKFESGASDWTVTGNAGTGEWVLEEPVGTWNPQGGSPPETPYVQPEYDHSPAPTDSICWVTGNNPPGTDVNRILGANDIDDGSTILTSPEYDLTDFNDPYLRYYRWYTNEAGDEPNQDFWEVLISEDGGQNWRHLERTRSSLAQWTSFIFRVKDEVEDLSRVRVRFIASDDAPGSLVEAAVDDFEFLDLQQSSVDVSPTPVASEYALEQNYPNPFNPSTRIDYAVPSQERVVLKVYDMLGNEIATLVDRELRAGRYTADFSAADIPSGVYIYRLITSSTTLSRKMVIAR
ncbi:MAG: hypothetical protein CL946_04570 [Ectothiorhodospiraceae bacterium]|nr:hypothetical protein [Ectothiorhodospiraceae bacterium]